MTGVYTFRQKMTSSGLIFVGYKKY